MHLLRDLRYGLRLITASPWVSASAVLALALGIGANTVIFSVVYNTLLRPLPVRDPHRLVAFSNYNERRNINSGAMQYADVCEWRRSMRSFEAIAASQTTAMSLSDGGEPERANVGKVTANFFLMLGVRTAFGRDFSIEEDRPGRPHVAVISYPLWLRRFAANPNAVGATISLDGDAYIIVGVLPEGFRFVGQRMDAYIPLAARESRGARTGGVTAYGRLKQGVSPAALQHDLDEADAAVDAAVPAHKGWLIRTNELSEWIVPDVKLSLWLLLGAVVLVLLIACANVAGLLLSRAAVRRREIAVRAALGAGRGRLFRQLLAEGVPLGALGAGLGLLLAWWGVSLLPLIPADRIPRIGETRIDFAVLAFTAGVSILTCLLFALAPATTLSRADVHDTLKEGGRSGGGRGSRVRSALVICEVALALVLSVGATLMIRTFARLSAVDPGFNPRNLLTASIDIPRYKYATGKGERILAFYSDVLDRVRALPGVQSACLTTSLPLGGNYYRADFRIQGRDYSNPADVPIVNVRTVDDAYFRTLQIPLRKGRYFTPEDRLGAPPVMVINETTARRFFPDEEPIGKRIGGPESWRTIVGVVADIRHTDVSQGADTEVLAPFWQAPALSTTVAVRTDAAMYPDAGRLIPLLRRTITSADKDQAIARTLTMEKIMADRLAPRRLSMFLLMFFAGLALLLAALGIYGVLSYSVERRTHEIGIRVALGAARRDVIRMVVREAMILTAAGIAAGIAASLALTRLISGLIYGVSASDPATLVATAVILTAVGALAAWLPARRATGVDAMVALCYE